MTIGPQGVSGDVQVLATSYCPTCHPSAAFSEDDDTEGRASRSLSGSNSPSVVGLKLGNQSLDNTTHPITIVIPLAPDHDRSGDSFARCRYWDETDRRWSGRGCLIANYTETSMVCCCFHLTDFSSVEGDSSVPMNSVDPIGDAGAFASISLSQIIVIATLGVFFVVFMMAVIWGEYKDARDCTRFRQDPSKYVANTDMAEYRMSKQFYHRVKYQVQKSHVLLQIRVVKPYSALSRSAIVTIFAINVTTTMMTSALFYSAEPLTVLQGVLVGIYSGLMSFAAVSFFGVLFKLCRRRAQQHAQKRHFKEKTAAAKVHPEPSAGVTIDPLFQPGEQTKKWVNQMAGMVAAKHAATVWRRKVLNKKSRHMKILDLVTADQKGKIGSLSAVHTESKLSADLFVFVYGVSFLWIGFMLYLDVLYGITFPDDLAHGWLVGTSAGTIFNVIVLDPIKIFVFSVIYFSVVHRIEQERLRKVRRAAQLRMASVDPRTGAPDVPTLLKHQGLPGDIGDMPAVQASGLTARAMAQDISGMVESATQHKVTHGVYRSDDRSSWTFTHTARLADQAPLFGNELYPGVIHALCTGFDRRSYEPPVDKGTGLSRTRGGMMVAASRGGGPTAYTATFNRLKGVECVVEGSYEEPPWVMVDLGENTYVIPEHFAVAHGVPRLDQVMSNWMLQGSADGVHWTSIVYQEEDVPFAGGSYVHMWPADARPACRFLRLCVTGRNLSGNFNLAIAGFEVYGAVFTLQPSTFDLFDRVIRDGVQESLVGSSLWPGVPKNRSMVILHANPARSVFESAGDGLGLLELLGTVVQTTGYKNPVERGLVEALASACADGGVRGRPRDVVDYRYPVEFVSEDEADAHFTLDFGATRRVQLHSYGIRAGQTKHLPRHWKVLGSNDGKRWVLLRLHENDPSLLDKASVHRFALNSRAATRAAFRFFRIQASGRNAAGNKRLSLGSMELFGAILISNSNGWGLGPVMTPRSPATMGEIVEEPETQASRIRSPPHVLPAQLSFMSDGTEEDELETVALEMQAAPSPAQVPAPTPASPAPAPAPAALSPPGYVQEPDAPASEATVALISRMMGLNTTAPPSSGSQGPFGEFTTPRRGDQY